MSVHLLGKHKVKLLTIYSSSDAGECLERRVWQKILHVNHSIMRMLHCFLCIPQIGFYASELAQGSGHSSSAAFPCGG